MHEISYDYLGMLYKHYDFKNFQIYFQQGRLRPEAAEDFRQMAQNLTKKTKVDTVWHTTRQKFSICKFDNFGGKNGQNFEKNSENSKIY